MPLQDIIDTARLLIGHPQHVKVAEYTSNDLRYNLTLVRRQGDEYCQRSKTRRFMDGRECRLDCCLG
jgi:hypothetical protein